MLHDLEDLAARLDAIGPTTAGVAAAVRRAARQWSALDVIRRALTDRPDPHAARLRLAASVLTLAAGVVHDATEQRGARDELVTSAAALLDLARSMLDARPETPAGGGVPRPRRGIVTRVPRHRRGRA